MAQSGCSGPAKATVSASVSALSVSCRQLGSVGGRASPQNDGRCQLWSLAVSSCPVLAMQKVEGSSPFIRLGSKPFWVRLAFGPCPVHAPILEQRRIAT